MMEKPLLPIIHDPHLSAIEKFQGFFDTLDRLRIAHKADVVTLGRVWYTGDNAIVRQKVDEAVREQRAPLLNEIVRQGIREGAGLLLREYVAGQLITSGELRHSLGRIMAEPRYRGQREPCNNRCARVAAIDKQQTRSRLSLLRDRMNKRRNDH